MHHTALYRYFSTKDDLLSAVFVRLAEGILHDTKGRLLSCAMGNLIVLVTAGSLPQAQAFQVQIVGMLREMGVAESDLARSYQALETHVIGGSYYDYTSAPDHLSQRRTRYREANDVSLDQFARKDSDIDDLNETTFMWVLDLILDGAVRN